MMKKGHVKNEHIHQNTMLKFHDQIFDIQFVMEFLSCTKTLVWSRIIKWIQYTLI